MFILVKNSLHVNIKISVKNNYIVQNKKIE